MRIAILGSTRGCGLEALLLLLSQGDSNMELHVLVRNKTSFLETLSSRSIDDSKLGQLHITVGDALKLDSVKGFFQSVANRGPIDYVISSLGVTPDFSNINWRSPLSIMPPGTEHICGESMRNILASLEAIALQQRDAKAPSLIVVSSNGMGKTGHASLPLMLRPMCEYNGSNREDWKTAESDISILSFYLSYSDAMIKQPHADKCDMEEVLHKAYNIPSPDFNRDVKNQDSVGANITFDKTKLFILRPSLLTDGVSKGAIRSSQSTLSSAWSISRKDVGAYIVRNCMLIGDKITEKKTQEKSQDSGWGNGIVISY